MSDNLVPVLNPQGETVQIKADDLQEALTQGFKPAAPSALAIPEPAKAPDVKEAPPVNEAIVPDKPDFIKVINKSTGEPVLIKKSEANEAPTDQFELYSKEREDHFKEVQADLQSLKNPKTHFASSDPTLLSKYKDESLFNKDGDIDLLVNGQPKSVSMAEAIPLLAQPDAKLANSKLQVLYDAAYQKAKEESNFAAGVRHMVPGGSGPIARGIVKFDPTNNAIDHVNYLAQEVSDPVNHPTASTIGNVLGAINMPVPGGAAAKTSGAVENFLAGETPGAIRAGASWAAGKAAEGVVINSLPILAQGAIDKDLKGAAESALLSGGINLGLNLGLKGLSAATRTVVDSIKPGYVTDALKSLGATDEALVKAGTPEQQENFIKALESHGITAENAGEKAPEVISKMAQGEDLLPAAAKIDPFVEKSPVDSLSSKIDGIAQKGASLEGPGDTLFMKSVDGMNDKLNQLADKDGNISLPNLLKFAQDVGKEVKFGDKTDVLNIAKEQIHNEALQEVFDLGNNAIKTGTVDAKTALLWSNDATNAEFAKQLHTATLVPQVTAASVKPSTNPIVKLVKHVLTHKAMSLGAMAGSAIGGHVGAGIGAMAASAGAKFLDGMVENSDNPSLVKFLTKKAGSPELSSYMTLAALHANSQKLEQIPDVLKALVVKGGTKFASDDPIKEALGKSANGLSKMQQFNKLSDQLSLMEGNPQLKQQHIMDLISPFETNHPALAAQMKQDLHTKIQFIHDIMPKDKRPIAPFVKREEFEPSKQDLDDFAQQLKIAHTPYALLDGLKNGTITHKQVAVASALNPAILEQIRDKIAQESTKHDLNYQQRLSASLIMGAAMDDSLSKVQQLQSMYGPSSPAQQMGSGPPPKQSGKGGSGKGLEKMPGAQYTQAQKLSK